jgi:methylated-DNA-[protein]-cysteine S-methyltransferase
MIVDSPIGPLRLTANETAVTGLWMGASGEFSASESPILNLAAAQLGEYFEGKRTDFELPLEPDGTDFERSVWHELTRIPYGETISYGQLANRLGNPKAVRAVGRANGQNPISIIIPCHRVIGASGHLVGYGGGLDRKRLLLDLEKSRERLSL